MRLDRAEREALRAALSCVDGEVYLFGSRVDDARKGGDIDLLVLSSESSFELSRAISTRFFSHCEEKIDVVVLDPNHLKAEQTAFLRTINKIELRL